MATVAEAREELARAITLAGLQRDPLQHPLRAMVATLDAMETVARDVRSATTEAAAAIRQPISPEAEAATVKRLETAATRGADRHTAALVQQHGISNLIAGIAAATACIVVTGLGSYWFGRNQALSEAQAWAAAQTARVTMLADGPTLPVDEAAIWSQLIRYNPGIIREMVAKAPRQRDSLSGRASGSVVLWLESPQPATPKQ